MRKRPIPEIPFKAWKPIIPNISKTFRSAKRKTILIPATIHFDEWRLSIDKVTLGHHQPDNQIIEVDDARMGISFMSHAMELCKEATGKLWLQGTWENSLFGEEAFMLRVVRVENVYLLEGFEEFVYIEQ